MGFGKHLILDLGKCCRVAVKDPELIKTFARDLVAKIEMEPYGEPRVVHFGKGALAGNTLVQLISTSSITGHFCDDSGDAYIDVFSCKHFRPKDVMEIVHKYFLPKTCRQVFIERGSHLTETIE